MCAALLALALAAALPSPEVAQTLALPGHAAEMLIVHRAPVDLPQEALELGIRGRVRFSIHVSPHGRVLEAYLISGHPLLVEAARKAVMLYRLQPLLLNGRRLPWRSTITVPVPTPDWTTPKRVA